MGNIQDQLIELRGLGVESAGNVSSEEERARLGLSDQRDIDRLTAAANTRYQDRYLFSGGTVNTATVKSTDNTIQFSGNDLNLLTIADNGEYIAHNVTGQKALGLISDGVVSRANLAPAAIGSTRLADLNGGKGISPGAIQLSDGLERITVDLTGAETLDNVIERVNTAPAISGRHVEFSINNGAIVAGYADVALGNCEFWNPVRAERQRISGFTFQTKPLRFLSLETRSIRFCGQRRFCLSSWKHRLRCNGGIRIEQNGKSYSINLGTASRSKMSPTSSTNPEPPFVPT